MPNPEDPQESKPSKWDELPDKFTPEWVRSCPMRRLIEIEQGLSDLTPLQQDSYRRSVKVVLGPSLAVARRALADKGTATNGLKFNPAIGRTIRRLQEQADAASSVLTSPPGPTGPTGATAPTVAPPSTNQLGPVGATAGDLSANMIDLSGAVEDMSKAAIAIQHHQERTQDDELLGILVAFAVIVAGVAPIVAAPGWCERIWTGGISIGLFAVAYAVYRIRRRKRSAAVK